MGVSTPRAIRRAETLPVRFEDSSPERRAQFTSGRRRSRSPPGRSILSSRRPSVVVDINNAARPPATTDEDSPWSETDVSINDVSIAPRRYRRNTRSSRYYYDSDEDSLEGDFDTYDFRLPRFNARPLAQDDISFRSEPSTKVEVPSDPTLRTTNAGFKAGKVYHIYRSEYTGEGSVGGIQSAELTAIHDPKKSSTPLFRWVHFEDRDMNFEDFHNGVLQISELTDAERTSITNLLRRVRKKFDKPLQISNTVKVRYMEPGVLQAQLPQEGPRTARASNPATVTWFCLPYFSLEEYSGLFSSSKPGSHPLHTLLQARFTLTRRERDLQQAVCNIPGTPRHQCFHIAQLWCLILDDSLLVTCARLPLTALKGDAISIINSPTQASTRTESPRLLVSYGDSVLWSLSVGDCDTWFTFLSNFWEFWPRPFQITYNGSVLTAETWPRVLDLAKLNRRDVRLGFHLGPSTRSIGPILSKNPPSTAGGKTANGGNRSLESAQQDDSQQANETRMPSTDPFDPTATGFNVFTWVYVDTPPGSTRLTSSAEQLNEDLELMDSYLRHDIIPLERAAYKACQPVSRSAVQSLVEAQGADGPSKGIDWERKLAIFNSADSIFQFFFPATFEGPTVLKYWGGVHHILTAPTPDQEKTQQSRVRRSRNRREEDDLDDVLEEYGVFELSGIENMLEQVAQKLRPVKELLSEASPVDRASFKIPQEFTKAWLYIVMALVLWTQRDGIALLKADMTGRLISRGTKEAVRCLAKKPLVKKSVFMPFDVAALLSCRLLGDATGHSQADIAEVYSEYLSSLEAHIEAEPVERRHQDNIARFRKEVSVVRQTLKTQAKVFEFLASSISNGSPESRVLPYRTGNVYSPMSRPREDGGYSRPGHSHRLRSAETRKYVSPTTYIPTVIVDVGQSTIWSMDPSGFRGLLFEHCRALVDDRIRTFGEMDTESYDLAQANIQRIDSNKDRQESAIYVFTIVTVVFLPLSTVASILGMNTKDVRNMDLDQWVFWAVALPVMLAVIVICLIFTGMRDSFWRGIGTFWRHRESDASRFKYGVVDPFWLRRPSRSSSSLPLIRYHTDSEDDMIREDALKNISNDRQRMILRRGSAYRHSRRRYVGE